MEFSGGSVEAAFAANLRVARDAKGVTQAALAEAMNQHGFKWYGPTVYKIETGERQVLLGEALALSRILDIGVGELATPESDGLKQRIAVEDTYRRLAAVAHKVAVENLTYTMLAAQLRDALQNITNAEGIFPADALAHLRGVSAEDSELFAALSEVRRVLERVWPEDGLDLSEARSGEPFSETVATARASKLRRSTTVLGDTGSGTKTATYVERPISTSTGPQPDTVRRSRRAKT